MESTWDIIQKELAYHGIKLIDNRRCQYRDENGIRTLAIDKCIAILRKRMSDNSRLLAELWIDLSCDLETEPCQQYGDPLDHKTVVLFIESLKELFKFARLLSQNYQCYCNVITKNNILDKIRSSIDRDYKSFPKATILHVPDYKTSLDWIYRRNSILTYLIKLLKFAKLGESSVSQYIVKTARGVQGPWGNLDLPMLERQFHWDDIEEEVRGRDRDIKRQHRYRMGLENYNNGGKVGEGFYWREIRNEPFSWYDRDTEDPYPSRHTLSRWG